MRQYSAGFIAAFNEYLDESLGVRLGCPYTATSFSEVAGL